MNSGMMFLLAPLGSVTALLFAFIFHKKMVSASEGDDLMKDIAKSVRSGAMAYLKEQYKAVIIFFLCAFVFIGFLSFVLKVQSYWTPFAFITGGFFSGLAGFIGMNTATRANSRTANAAKTSLDAALKVAFRSGAVMGLTVVGLGLLDISIWFMILRKFYGNNFHIITTTMLSFGMGASAQALFARVGGGIFTKAADVGADLVGKIESNIPEDDPRNPAVIADNVGDNVGDVAGMGADLYESYCGSVLSAAALGAAASVSLSLSSGTSFNLIILPMMIAAIGIFASIIGIYMVKTKEGADQIHLMESLNKGIDISSLIIAVLSFFAIKLLLNNTGINFINIWVSMIVGLFAGILIGKVTEYYTSFAFKPTRFIAEQSKTGPATVILAGLGESMTSTGLVVLIVSTAIVFSYLFSSGFDISNISLGLYGIAISAVGMLSTLGITLATDAYGPIADNAGGNAQMSHQPEDVRERTDALDALGNTTAATGKGFAIGSAALTALALLASYIEEIRVALMRMAENNNGIIIIEKETYRMTAEEIAKLDIVSLMNMYSIHLLNFRVLVGIFIGAMMPFLFSGLTIKAVGRAAGKMVEEVRRQFREIPGIMEGKVKPDYAKCVSISAKAAEKEMVFPAVLAVITPIITGLVLGLSGVMGMLTGALGSGFVLAVMMANAGGAWDNAKKFVESGEHGGKNTPNHVAAVIGDTVGDPLKDTAGPSLNILIKLMSMVAIVTAGLIASFSLF
ncbi:MAG: sodium-translocating pyrophosphatase [bacterium]